LRRVVRLRPPARAVVDRLRDVLRRFAVLRLAVLRLAVLRFAVLRFAVLRLRDVVRRFAVLRFAVLRLAVPRFAVLRLRDVVRRLAVPRFAVLRLAVLRLAVLRFRDVVRRFAVLRLAVLRFAVLRFAVLRFREAILRLRVPVDFRAAVLRAPPAFLRALEARLRRPRLEAACTFETASSSCRSSIRGSWPKLSGWSSTGRGNCVGNCPSSILDICPPDWEISSTSRPVSP
jgi:hypothetical protein